MVSVKELKLAGSYILTPTVTSIVVLGALSLLPTTSPVAHLLHSFRLWIYGHWIALLIISLCLLLYTSTRGTLRNVLMGMNSNKPGIFLGLFGIYMLLAYWKAGEFGIPNKPSYYAWLGSGAVACTVFVAWSRLTIRPYKPKKGTLAGDDALDNRQDLAHDQVVILDNLKNLLLNQQLVRAIGLYGDWGTGKTSIYRTAKSEIQYTDKRIVWAEIEPWRYTSQESLVLGFYEEIGKALEKYIPGVQNSAAKLLQVAEPLVRKNDKTGLFVTILNWIQGIANRQLADPGTYIREILKREGRYLVVAIDNVERNTSHLQVMRTLQLVHFLKSEYVTYVFISEKAKLLSFVGEDNNEDKAKYLEKFIEYELEILPPHKTELRSFLNSKLSGSTEAIPLDFTVNVPDSIIEDVETYRGIIKLFNQFILELDKRFFRDDHYIVSLEDKIALDHIRLKYPLLWRSIERNRDFYDGGNRDMDLMYRYALQEDEQDRIRRETITEAVEVSVPERKRERVKELLGEIFPQSKHLLGRSVRSNPDLTRLRREGKVAHPDVLDTYFARSNSQEDYEAELEVITKVLQDMFSAQQESEMIKIIGKYLEHLGEVESKRDSIRLFLGELSYKNLKHDDYRRYLRAIVRAYTRNIDFVTLDEDDGVLVSIISAVNDFATKNHADEQAMAADLDFIFSELWKPENMKHPSIMLRMLLYMLPQRQNQFYAIDRWGAGYQNLRRKGLKYVDNFYFAKYTSPVLYDSGRDYEWRFIFFQWALSVHTIGSTLFELRGSKKRFNDVNDYALGLLKNDPKLAYTVIMRDFWGTKWSSETEPTWQIDKDKLMPYDVKKLNAVIEQVARSRKLSPKQKLELKEFLTKLKKYL